MSRQQQKAGQEAEQRVANMATGLGYGVEYSTEADFGGETDLKIDGAAVQVSCDYKSKGAQERLEQKGITNIAAGPDIEDDAVRYSLRSLKR